MEPFAPWQIVLDVEGEHPAPRQRGVEDADQFERGGEVAAHHYTGLVTWQRGQSVGDHALGHDLHGQLSLHHPTGRRGSRRRRTRGPKALCHGRAGGLHLGIRQTDTPESTVALTERRGALPGLTLDAVFDELSLVLVLVVEEVEARLVAGLQRLKDSANPVESVLCAHLDQDSIIDMSVHHGYLRLSLSQCSVEVDPSIRVKGP